MNESCQGADRSPTYPDAVRMKFLDEDEKKFWG